MNLENIKRIVEKNTLLLMYEPGAGGDFLTALLSVDPKINGSESSIDFHDNGRIKATKTKTSVYVNKTVNDYEFYDGDNYFELLKSQLINDLLSDLVTSKSKYISKVHPYFNDPTNLEKLSSYIENNYRNSAKVMLTRQRDICIQNHISKNCINENEIYYNDEWYGMYDKLKSKYDDIVTISFENLITNPIHTLKKIYTIMGYSESEITHNFSINEERIKDIYVTYMNNQTNIEHVERYWT